MRPVYSSTVLLLMAAILIAAQPARGDQWVTPQPVTVKSPSGRWQATVVPAKDGKSGATATVRPPRGQPTSFTLRSPWMPVDVVLLDDGLLVAFDQWHSLGHGQVAIAYAPQGKVRWTRTLEELVGKGRVVTFTHSVSSIWWRPTPLVWSLERGCGALLVRLRDEHQVRIRLADGKATIIAVDKLPDDPARLGNRAGALANAGRLAEAVALLERAVALKPDDLPLQLRLVEALQRLERHDQAVAAGQAVVKRLGGRAADGTNLANLHVLVAASHQASKRPAEAERSLRAAVAAAPGYDHPSLRLADFLRARGRLGEVDAIFHELVARAGGPSATNIDYLLLNVGDFYRRAGQPAKARTNYLKAFRPDRVTNQFLYQALAEVHETLGDPRAALDVYRQLVAHFTALGPAFKHDLERARQNVARLERTLDARRGPK
ncbi:MAG: tetratricopeptide repeat protein [Deltaproteobacteria bacterium]|nr:tetratricopeptide repeat protein [Deltaproteobacteria bacterium]